MWLIVMKTPRVSNNSISFLVIKELCVMCVWPIRNWLITVFFSGESGVLPWIYIVFNRIEFSIKILSMSVTFVNDVRVNFVLSVRVCGDV